MDSVLDVTGWSADEWGRRSGVAGSTISRFRKHPESPMPTSRTLEKLEAAVPHMMRVARPPSHIAAYNSATLTPLPVGRTPIVGIVEAGAWRVVVEDDSAPTESVEAFPDARYPGIERFALRVRGPSMDKVFPDGAVVTCVKLIDINRNPLDGEYVVVHRRRPGGLTEATVKQCIRKNGKVYLWPRSSHPDHQQPLDIESSGEDEDVLIQAAVIRVTHDL
tara:strand:+ start:1862 stop:2521 length:660 start_codon:yes stop_codon:yes gene_type:complete